MAPFRVPRRMVALATQVLRNPSRLSALTEEADVKAATLKDQLGDLFEGVQTLLRMIRAWVARQYTEIPWVSLSRIVLGVFYFVWVVDTIPDFIPGVGYVDDFAVLSWILTSLRRDIGKFREWERTQK